MIPCFVHNSCALLLFVLPSVLCFALLLLHLCFCAQPRLFPLIGQDLVSGTFAEALSSHGARKPETRWQDKQTSAHIGLKILVCDTNTY